MPNFTYEELNLLYQLDDGFRDVLLRKLRNHYNRQTKRAARKMMRRLIQKVEAMSDNEYGQLTEYLLEREFRVNGIYVTDNPNDYDEEEMNDA